MTPAVVTLAATGPVPHRDRVRVAGGDAAADSRFDAGNRIVHGAEHLHPSVVVQSVRVGDESEPCRPIRGSPAEPSLVEFVVDGNAKAGEVGNVVDGAARGSELEVQERNGDAVAEYNVVRADVVVAH